MGDTQKHTKPNVPNLRFPGFEGEWEQHLLSEYLDFKNGLNPSAKSFGEGIKFISVMDILNNPFITYDCIRASVNATEKEKQEFNVEYGDILFQRSSETLEDVGHANVYLDSRTALFGGFTIRGKKKGVYNPLFFKYLLDSPTARKKVIVKGAGAQHFNIGQEGLSKVVLSFPSIQEQNRIAVFMNLLDQRIAIQNKVIERYESLIKALCHNLIISSKGKVCHIGDILKIGSGKDYKHLNAGSVPVFGTGGYMLSVSDWLYEGESVCIGRKGTINNPFYVEGKFWTVDTLFYTYDFEGVLPKYCYYLFQTIDWLQYNEASGVPSLSKSTIERIRISIPSIDEQAKAVQVLDRVEMAITCWRELLNHYESIKQYLLSQLFI